MQKAIFPSKTVRLKLSGFLAKIISKIWLNWRPLRKKSKIWKKSLKDIRFGWKGFNSLYFFFPQEKVTKRTLSPTAVSDEFSPPSLKLLLFALQKQNAEFSRSLGGIRS
jgi:hypothetical protein